MKWTKLVGTTAAVSAVLAVVAVGVSMSAPAPAPKPVDKWEYAELRHQHRVAYEDNAGQVFPAKTNVSWTTSKAVAEATGWEDLGSRLKAPGSGKAGTEDLTRLRVFDRLGEEGWELAGPPEKPGRARDLTVSQIWSFKRRVR